ncbi:DUF1002 domain-containing protein [Mechercharimyces sp. CAU 1602]|uniref:DUF1002 domain-containing protein n=1 Tax=Mechercharimyces sp. CAU 1602 TaxID=2973933 RepID=UPI002161B5A8|nr:DUF1002 domain-containing protein [Mechercharimyces sp. CAU 1602]MCS1351522.1 DUF1002 domain-containing protein [Mechercharimyces sp. CAU 1602]
MKKKWISALLTLAMVFTFVPTIVHADAVVGETVVTLGQNLTQEQRSAMLQEMGVNEKDVQVIEVTNAEEHQYLGDYMSKATIGTRALSSAKITLAETGTGITVETKNISTITEMMYSNALITAGVKDADVYVTAPFPVSGTAGLTGVIKAFESATDKKISEEQKQVANEEMVRTSEIGEQIGDTEKAAELIMRVKEEIAEQQPQSPEEIKQIIINVAGDLNINLTEQNINDLTNLMDKFSQLDIDWDQLSSQLDQFKEKWGDALQSAEEAKGFFDKLINWLSNLLDSLTSIFS